MLGTFLFSHTLPLFPARVLPEEPLAARVGVGGNILKSVAQVRSCKGQLQTSILMAIGMETKWQTLGSSTRPPLTSQQDASHCPGCVLFLGDHLILTGTPLTWLCVYEQVGQGHWPGSLDANGARSAIPFICVKPERIASHQKTIKAECKS